ncbi:phosphinothricin acetyltransferase [Caryophanon tenue]|uniref:Phosphinothricin acetyltransferase n=1 Tax=Caryophanon tenue TaxID=33978 RepID=A0A1C0Y785_9BACL|nr:phosphinothricin acetyltransferase [Caryophanon tenue]
MLSVTTLTYRDATLDDLQTVIDIYNTIIEGRMVTADTEPVTIHERLEWFHAHNPATRPLWIIEGEKDDIVYGWISFQSFYGRAAYNGTAEISIYLAESARGKGLGTTVLHYALERAPQLHIKTVLAFIFGHNTPSLKLFEKVGFERWAHLPQVAQLDDVERDLIILGKRVAQS